MKPTPRAFCIIGLSPGHECPQTFLGMPSKLLDELLVRIGFKALPERLKALSYLAAGAVSRGGFEILEALGRIWSSSSNSWAMSASCKRCEHRRSAAGRTPPPVVTGGIYYADGTPTPEVPTVTLSWLAFSQVVRSFRLFAGTVLLVTIIMGLPGTCATGSKSFKRS
jgi:hypothetical protein